MSPGRPKILLGVGGLGLLLLGLAALLRPSSEPSLMSPPKVARPPETTVAEKPATVLGKGPVAPRVENPKINELPPVEKGFELKKPPSTPSEPKEPTPEQLRTKANQAQVLNEKLAGEARVKALLLLRSAGPEAITPKIVESMIRLLQTSPEAKVRRLICVGLKGQNSEELTEALVLRLLSDQDSTVKMAAAGVLGDLRDSSRARSALALSADSDSAEEVRMAARRALGQ